MSYFDTVNAVLQVHFLHLVCSCTGMCTLTSQVTEPNLKKYCKILFQNILVSIHWPQYWQHHHYHQNKKKQCKAKRIVLIIIYPQSNHIKCEQDIGFCNIIANFFFIKSLLILHVHEKDRKSTFLSSKFQYGK